MRRLEKAVVFSTRYIQSILLLFGDLRPHEQASLFFKKIEGHFFDGFETKMRVIIYTSSPS